MKSTWKLLLLRHKKLYLKEKSSFKTSSFVLITNLLTLFFFILLELVSWYWS